MHLSPRMCEHDLTVPVSMVALPHFGAISCHFLLDWWNAVEFTGKCVHLKEEVYIRTLVYLLLSAVVSSGEVEVRSLAEVQRL